MPEAILSPAEPGGVVCMEIDASLGDLGPGLVIQGFDFQATPYTGGQTAIWIYNDFNLLAAHDVSPLIQGNTFTDFGSAIWVDSHGAGSTANPEIRFNHITTSEDLGTQPSGYGIIFQTHDGASIDGVTRSNKIEKMETGIGLLGWNGPIRSLHQCDRIMRCEWGLYADGDVLADAVHATIAHGHPASPGMSLQGIESWLPATVSIYNSIIWIPNELDAWGNIVPGNDLVGDGIVLDSFTTVEALTPGLNPQFVDVLNYDLRLLPSSPMIDFADIVPVQPGGSFEIPYDNDWEPRVLDGAFDGSMLPDRGAHEFTEVGLDFLASQYPNYSPSGKPFVQLKETGDFSIEVTGPGGALYFLWVQPKYGQFNNLSFLALGNLQLLPVYSLASGTLPLISGKVQIPISLQGTQVESDWEAQAVVVTTVLPTGEYRGAFTRRIELEVNY